MIKLNLATVAMACALVLAAGGEAVSTAAYQVTRDEFSNSDVHRLILGTKDSGFGALSLSCFPSGLQAQVHVKSVIFPDDTNGGHMWVQVTHKVDTAAEASTKKWRMNMMKYHDAWLTSGISRLIEEMQKGERLSLRLDRNGTIYRFDLKEAHEHLPKLLTACAKRERQPSRSKK